MAKYINIEFLCEEDQEGYLGELLDEINDKYKEVTFNQVPNVMTKDEVNEEEFSIRPVKHQFIDVSFVDYEYAEIPIGIARGTIELTPETKRGLLIVDIENTKVFDMLRDKDSIADLKIIKP